MSECVNAALEILHAITEINAERADSYKLIEEELVGSYVAIEAP